MLDKDIDEIEFLIKEAIDSHNNELKKKIKIASEFDKLISGQVQQIYFRTMRKDQAKIEDRFSVKLIKFLEEKLVKRLELGKRKLLQVAILNHKEDVIDSQQYSSLGEQVVHIDQYLSNQYSSNDKLESS
jgi:hypothetical protein